MKKLSVLSLVLTSLLTYGQSSIWNANTLDFKSDTVSALENMTGATTATFPSGSDITALIPFTTGFSFHYGLDSFTQFSVSKYGFVKLGAVASSNYPIPQDSVIVAFYASNLFSAVSYKYMGTAPYRVLVIEWSGTLSQTFQSIRFQLLLHETNGKIQMVYSGNNAWSSGNGYEIFLRQSLLGLKHIATVDVRTGLPPLPAYNSFTTQFGYSTYQLINKEKIQAFQRFTFQPDTVKPAIPAIQFQNVLPGCMNVYPFYDFTKASAFLLQKQKRDLSYSTPVLIGANQSFYDSTLYADTTYRYRGISTNGFVLSDTVVQTRTMPSPLISGVKTIPGDYPSITAFLQAAKCSLVGPTVILELQSSYTYSLEPGTVNFTGRLRSSGLQHIIIRPAAGASVVIESAANSTMFRIDSLSHVEFDGRQGGTGTTPSLIIRHTSMLPGIVYTNAADSGDIRYVKFEGNGQNGNGMVFITSRDQFYSLNKLPVTAFKLRNCLFGPPSGSIYSMVYAENAISVLVEQNEFFRFAREAVTFRKCVNPVLRSNRFYQPDNFQMSGNAVVLIDSCGLNALVEYNRFGGSTAAWGTDKWQTSCINSLAIIKSKAGITARGNEFGNIHINANTVDMIQTWDGALLHSNRVGTADSVKSITAPNFLYIFRIYGGQGHIVDSNFISGVYAGGELGVCGLLSSGTSGPSSVVAYNDFGGADNYLQNGTEGDCRILSINQGNMLVHHNKVRGFKARLGICLGIEDHLEAHTGTMGELFVENNTINHLMGKYSVYGIGLRAYSFGFNRVSNNTIYALRGISSAFLSTSTNVIGINLNNNDLISMPTSVLEVSNNTIHSFDREIGASQNYYSIAGISIWSSGKARAFNNVIRLGLDTKGGIVDSLGIPASGITVYGNISEAEHNSIIYGPHRGHPVTGRYHEQ
jgi:hypothetical protein